MTALRLWEMRHALYAKSSTSASNVDPASTSETFRLLTSLSRVVSPARRSSESNALTVTQQAASSAPTHSIWLRTDCAMTALCILTQLLAIPKEQLLARLVTTCSKQTKPILTESARHARLRSITALNVKTETDARSAPKTSLLSTQTASALAKEDLTHTTTRTIRNANADLVTT